MNRLNRILLATLTGLGLLFGVVAIGAPAAVQNAVVDTVSHLGVRHIDMPLTPWRVWKAIRDARR